MDHRTYFAWKTTDYYVKLTCLLTVLFIFIVKKVEKIRSYVLGFAAQDGGVSKSSVPYNERSGDCFSRGRSMANINLPQGE